MKNNAFLLPSFPETRWGIRYTLFSFFVLPWLLNMALGFLQIPLDALWLNLIFYGINFVAIVLIFRQLLGRTLRDFLQRPLRILGIAALCFGLYWVVTLLQSKLIYALFPSFVNVNDQGISQLAERSYIPMALATTILVPPAEELLFRGAMFGGLYSKKPWLAYLLSIAGFCYVHISAYIGLYSTEHLLLCMLQYIPAGAILAWAYRRSGSIFAPIIVHAAINVVGILSMR